LRERRGIVVHLTAATLVRKNRSVDNFGFVFVVRLVSEVSKFFYVFQDNASDNLELLNTLWKYNGTNNALHEVNTSQHE